jgi:hypothetical protein
MVHNRPPVRLFESTKSKMKMLNEFSIEIRFFVLMVLCERTKLAGPPPLTSKLQSQNNELG